MTMNTLSVAQHWMTRAHNAFFHSIHNRYLIYNTCWEDPRLDRQLLQLQSDSRVVMITSAGCNALDYLLDSPAAIHAVDVNPRQNALLQLKLALFEAGHFEHLFKMFGEGFHAAYQQIYEQIRAALPSYAQAYWDKHISYFERTRLKPSFYYHGTSGSFAWLFMNVISRLERNIKAFLFALLETQTLTEQRSLYATIEHQLWNAFHRWLIKHPVVMAMFGVPKAQIRLIVEQYPGGLVAYVRDKVRHVFTEVLMHDNYFWRVYLSGSYTPACCPNYLKPEYFSLLRERRERIMTHTSTITQFLQAHPAAYSHFVLLDHQDWLASYHRDLLEEEWRRILECSRAGTKILMRSASEHLHFLPDWVTASLRFFPERTEPLHRQDRVGTYGSLHLTEVR
ncbi:hypothetical protein U14_05276 [Candidatus Moduliflexus flocculans]|uniref:S-adenosylmethionine:diacylglycerol 3-amino-3-carboxypropyl transferase n=1 Tax=Candidatus Moduliflexus flocculans TaxID=1499966 RepID=A0A081BRG8_9BACT|nr:hypothetical protein U14_05276 [Candidatus Moduliflexus flocculans]